MRPLRIAWIALLVLAWDPRAAGAQACPTNYISVTGPYGPYGESSTAPSFGWFGMSYNLMAGTLSASLSGSGEVGTSGAISVQDRYRIVGPASGSPIPIQVRVYFAGVAGGWVVPLPYPGPMCVGSSATLSLTSGVALDEELVQSQYAPVCASQTIDHTLALDLQKLPGEEFVVSVRVSMHAGQSTSVTADGVITFAGLPPEYTIQSCQGYAVAPVPTARRTWGDIKRFYR